VGEPEEVEFINWNDWYKNKLVIA